MQYCFLNFFGNFLLRKMQLPIRVAREGGSPDGAVDPPPERCSDRHEEGAAASLQKPSEFPNRRKGRSGERLSWGAEISPAQSRFGVRRCVAAFFPRRHVASF